MGKENITEEVILREKSGRYKYHATFDRDTIDLFLLLNAERELLLPIRPIDDGSISISLKKSGQSEMTGMQLPDLLTSYLEWRNTPTDTLPTQWREALEGVQNHPLTYLLTIALEEHFWKMGCTEIVAELSVLRQGCNQDLAPLLGWDNFRAKPDGNQPFPSHIVVSGKQEMVPLAKERGKAPWLAVSYLPMTEADSTTMKAEAEYFQLLDSLGIPSYHLLMACDSLPKEWKKREANIRSKGKAGSEKPFRYFLIDSIGEATRFINQHYRGRLPQYLLVDSTQQVVRHWSEADSLLTFIKEYQAIEKATKQKKKDEEQQHNAKERSKK